MEIVIGDHGLTSASKFQYMTDTSAECIAIDARYLLNQISPIPKYVKTGKDLATEFCKRVEKLTMNASLVVVAFDNNDVSLKTGTRVIRYEKGW